MSKDTWSLLVAGISAIAAWFAIMMAVRRHNQDDLNKRAEKGEMAMRLTVDAIRQIELNYAKLERSLEDHKEHDEFRFRQLQDAVSRLDQKLDAIPQRVKDLLTQK